jgi:hypothetical protein
LRWLLAKGGYYPALFIKKPLSAGNMANVKRGVKLQRNCQGEDKLRFDF